MCTMGNPYNMKKLLKHCSKKSLDPKKKLHLDKISKREEKVKKQIVLSFGFCLYFEVCDLYADFDILQS